VGVAYLYTGCGDGNIVIAIIAALWKHNLRVMVLAIGFERESRSFPGRDALLSRRAVTLSRPFSSKKPLRSGHTSDRGTGFKLPKNEIVT
jgi:hypothetical protein